MYKLLRPIESLTNNLTMYVTTILALFAIVGMTLVLSFIGELGFSPLVLLATLATILASTYVVNRLFAWTFSTKPNRASGLITALILYLTLAPGDDLIELFKIALVGAMAMASKYVLVWRGRHIFNPAAVALTLGTVLGLSAAFWWVATPLLLPIVLIAGLIIVAKTRRYAMVGVFLGVAIVVSTLVALSTGYPILDALALDVLSGPLVFFAAVMLTEPLTSPSTLRPQLAYASLTGLLYSAQLPWVSTPNVSLLIGNAFSFIFGQRGAILLEVQQVQQIAPNTYELLAKSKRPLRYTAGQYIELSLPHDKEDSRGTRRVFSFASAPEEELVRLATKVADSHVSSFKQAFATLKPGTVLRASYVGGDFVLPADSDPVVLIAGGIGITPFRSMLAHMITTADKRPVVVLYIAKTQKDLLYTPLLSKAQKMLSANIIPILTNPPDSWSGEHGQLSQEMLARHIPDIATAAVYISGPPSLVDATRSYLSGDYKPKRIMTDYFSGY